MSTSYRFHPALPFATIWDNLDKLAKHGLRETTTPETKPTARCLSDGTNHLWVYASNAGQDTDLIRYGANNVEGILDILAEEFNTTPYSEHDLGYWLEIEEVEMDLESYQDKSEWATFVEDDGLENTRAAFLELVTRARELGLEVPATYPDGAPLPIPTISQMEANAQMETRNAR